MNKFRVKRTKEVTTKVEEYAYIYGNTSLEALAFIESTGYFNTDSIVEKSNSYKYGDIVLLEDEFEGLSEEDKNFEITTTEIHGLIDKCITNEELDEVEYDDVDDYIQRKFFKTYGREIQMCQDSNCCLWGYKDEMMSTGDGSYHSHCIKQCNCCGSNVNKSEINDNGLCWRCGY